MRTRATFSRHVAELFGGSERIPQSVRDILTNFGGAVKSFFAKKFLAKVLKGVLAGKAKGVGVAVGPYDSIASISMDPGQALEKLACKVPGGIHKIRTLRADANGFSIGFDF